MIFWRAHYPILMTLSVQPSRIKPELEKLKKELLASGFETALLSGSGSSFFCIGNGKPPSDPQLAVYPVQFINRSLDQWYTFCH